QLRKRVKMNRLSIEIWERLSILVSFLQSVVIGMVGIYFLLVWLLNYTVWILLCPLVFWTVLYALFRGYPPKTKEILSWTRDKYHYLMHKYID
ncbi:MAG TPA: hypothetical protein PLD54_00440, partial [Candidatus Levybacteria bacterium]|nr:hypothetical protein [Candidatus Levybacteria bacterium]